MMQETKRTVTAKFVMMALLDGRSWGTLRLITDKSVVQSRLSFGWRARCTYYIITNQLPFAKYGRPCMEINERMRRARYGDQVNMSILSWRNVGRR